MELKPLILGLLFIGLVFFLFSSPGGGGGKHGDHGSKPGAKPGGKPPGKGGH